MTLALAPSATNTVEKPEHEQEPLQPRFRA